MRPVNVKIAALGSSPWVTVNQLQLAFGIGLAVSLTSGASLTYTVQHTFDDPTARRQVLISRTLTTVTVTDTAHGLSVGDSVVITGSGFTGGDGTYDVASVVDANNYTYTSGTSGSATGSDNTFVASFRVFPHATLAAQIARASGNYAFPVQMVRLKVTVYASGIADLTLLQAIGF